MSEKTVFCCGACYESGLGQFVLVKTVAERNSDGSERYVTFDCPNCGEQCGFMFRGEE